MGEGIGVYYGKLNPATGAGEAGIVVMDPLYPGMAQVVLSTPNVDSWLSDAWEDLPGPAPSPLIACVRVAQGAAWQTGVVHTYDPDLAWGPNALTPLPNYRIFDPTANTAGRPFRVVPGYPSVVMLHYTW